MGAKESKNKKKKLERQKTLVTDLDIKNELRNPIKLREYKEIDEGKMFQKLEDKKEKVNYLLFLDFNDYMICLSKFTLENADSKDDFSKIEYSYSIRDNFYNDNFNIEYLQSFIESKILKHEELYKKVFHSENSQERSIIFKEFLYNLHRSLIPKIKTIQIENGVNEDDIHENTLMKKNAAIIYGLLYCEGYDWLKVRIFFNLFKDKDRKLKKSEDLDYFLFMLFTTATYCTCYARNQLSKYKNIGEVNEDDMFDIMKYFQVDTTKKVIEYTNKLLFGKEEKNELLYEQFRKKCEISDIKENASFLFSSKGIRSLYKQLSGIVIDKKNKKRNSIK